MYDIIFPVSIAIFGITFTLFTLFFSFIFSKREELRRIADIIKEGKGTLDTKKREKFTVKHIQKLRLLNKHIIILLFSSFVTSFIIFISRNLEHALVGKICAILTIALILYLVILFCFIIFYYKKSTKI